MLIIKKYELKKMLPCAPIMWLLFCVRSLHSNHYQLGFERMDVADFHLNYSVGGHFRT